MDSTMDTDTVLGPRLIHEIDVFGRKRPMEPSPVYD